MKKLFAIVLLVASAGISAETFYQTFPGTGIRDWSQPGFVIQETRKSRFWRGMAETDAEFGLLPWSYKPQYEGYQTIPGTDIRDFTAPGIGQY